MVSVPTQQVSDRLGIETGFLCELCTDYVPQSRCFTEFLQLNSFHCGLFQDIIYKDQTRNVKASIHHLFTGNYVYKKNQCMALVFWIGQNVLLLCMSSAKVRVMQEWKRMPSYQFSSQILHFCTTSLLAKTRN